MKNILVVLVLAMTFSVLSYADTTNVYGAYGAIAYGSHTLAVGKARNFPTRFDAERAAMVACNRWDCRPIVWVSNGCAALAVPTYHRYGHGWGVASKMGPAVNIARHECEIRHGHCYIRASLCSGFLF